MRDLIGVGLVGFGIAGRVFHGPFLVALPDFDLRVVADRRDPAFVSDCPKVVVDKPFTPTVREADRLIALARSADRVLSVFHSRAGTTTTRRCALPSRQADSDGCSVMSRGSNS